MSEIAIKILFSLGAKFLTESFVSRIVVHALQAASAKTTNKVDDKMVQDVADALGVK